MKSDSIKALLVITCLLVPNLSYASEVTASTIKDITEKPGADERVKKKLIEAPPSGPTDQFHRGTPRSGLLALAVAVKDKDYAGAVNYLDLRNLPLSLDREKLVRQRAIVISRAMNIDPALEAK